VLANAVVSANTAVCQLRACMLLYVVSSSVCRWYGGVRRGAVRRQQEFMPVSRELRG